MLAKKLILILVLLTPLILAVLFFGSIIENHNLPKLVNNEEETQTQNLKDEVKDEENEKAERTPIAKINNETELIKINRRLDFFFLFLLTVIIDLLFAFCWFHQVPESWLQEANIMCDDYCNKGESSEMLMHAVFNKCFEEIQAAFVDNRTAILQQRRTLSLSLENEQIATNCCRYFKGVKKDNFYVTPEVIAKLIETLFDKINAKWFSRTVILISLLSVLSVFLSFDFYFVIKSCYTVGWQKTIDNFTYRDLFSVYQVFDCHSGHQKVLGGLYLLFLGGCSLIIINYFQTKIKQTLANDFENKLEQTELVKQHKEPELTDDDEVDFWVNDVNDMRLKCDNDALEI